jgi:hypothetical protein
MFMPRRGDEDLYTLVDWTERAMNGGPEMKQYASQEEARDEWDKRIKLKSQEWGERVFEKIKVLDPFDVDSLEEQIAEARASGDIAKLATLPKPIRDVEVLIARTLLDQLVNVETLKLFKYLADTVAQDGEAPGYRYVPKHPAFGPLADKWVPEPVEYALQQRERVSTNFWSQLWATGYYYWKSAHVSWSPPTAGRQLMGIVTLQSLDGMNPVTDAPWLKRAVDQFRFAAANPSDPRAADWRRLVEENQITGGWTLDEADALARYVNENPTRWGPAVVKWVESHPRFVAAVRGAGRRVEKADEAAGRLYGLPDQAAKLASYLKKRHKWGWTHREASRSLWMYMNYGRAGRWAKKLRRHILGNPFVMFTEQAGKIFARAVRDRPIRLALLGASPHLMTLFSRLVLGVDDDEMDLLNSSPNRSRSWVDQYFQPMMPWRDGNGDPAFFDIRWVFPLASEFRVETGTHGLGIPLFLGHPFVSGAHEVLFNRDSWTGRDLFDRDLTPLQKLPGALAHMAEAMAPLPTLVHKPGGGGIKKMWDAYRGERDESFARAMAREVFGVSFKDPWIRRVDVLRLIEEKLGRNEREAAEHIMTLFNVVYRAEYAPIGPREAIRRAAR